MITIVCLKCRTALRTVGSEAEVHSLLGPGSEYYPESYPCPTDGCDGKAKYLEAISPVALSQLKIYDLTPQEVFAALEGLGLPPERDCGETAVRKAFGSNVTEVGVRQLRGANRSILDWIQFADGTRLYVAASAEGAVVYRLARRHSYAESAGG